MSGTILMALRLHAEALSSIPRLEISRVMVSILAVPLDSGARSWQGWEGEARMADPWAPNLPTSIGALD